MLGCSKGNIHEPKNSYLDPILDAFITFNEKEINGKVLFGNSDL